MQVSVLVVGERNESCTVHVPVLHRLLVVVQPDGVERVGKREVAPGTVLEAQVPVLELLPKHLEPKGTSRFSILEKLLFKLNSPNLIN